ncbi:cysteine desulfurase [Candidatus Gracilibacteria bacterium]|nr:cysteine desulfurase [Candidatus Gracilibacteria bacterium]MCF7898920.1 cysteine desulfurase [Candidatus Paceibacterota bacterium]
MNNFLKKIFKQGTSSQKRRVYLDNAGTTPTGARPKAALLESLSIFGNPSGIHKEGVEAGLLLDKARVMCATVLNAHSYEIYFVGSGTESCNLAVIGTYLGATKNEERRTNNYIPHIITSTIEHPAVLEPIQKLEREGKITVTYLPVYENGIVKVNDIREAITEDTILVSVMYANNEIGTLQPVKEIGRMLEEWKKENGRTHTSYPYFHVDACQAGNYCNLDAVRLRAHLVTVNSSKVYGPKGIALLYKREGIIIEPVINGGGQERGLRSGTESVALAYSFGIALTEAKELKEKEGERLRELRDYCKDELQKVIIGIKFYGAWDEYDSRKFLRNEFRLPNNINCRIPGISSEEMIIRLDTEGFAVSHKSACSSQVDDGSYVIKALGVGGVEANENIRITLGRSTTKGDITRLVLSIKNISIKFAN